MEIKSNNFSVHRGDRLVHWPHAGLPGLRPRSPFFNVARAAEVARMEIKVNNRKMMLRGLINIERGGAGARVIVGYWRCWETTH